MNDKAHADLLLEAVKMIEAVRDALTDRIHEAPPQPETYSAEEAWEKMEQGYRVDVAGVTKTCCWYMNGGGGIAYEGSTHVCPGIESWHTGSVRFTLHGIHPKAHEYALQRLKAAGLKVGSVVEVVHSEASPESFFHGWGWVKDFPVGSTFRVEGVNNSEGHVTADDAAGSFIPAHCLKLIEAAPYTPPCDAPDGFEWAGEERCPRENEWYWSMAYRRPAPASFDFKTDKHHILRKLPPQLKVGDRRWVEVEVERAADSDGDARVYLPYSYGLGCYYCSASALHATPGGGE